MKFWKRILRSLLRALLFGGIGLLLFTACRYYQDYQEFREYTNYKFASVADFFYQLNAEYWLDFQFVDQNVSEVTFWVEGDELPEGYRLFCRRESLTIGYDTLAGLYHDNEKRK